MKIEEKILPFAFVNDEDEFQFDLQCFNVGFCNKAMMDSCSYISNVYSSKRY